MSNRIADGVVDGLVGVAFIVWRLWWFPRALDQIRRRRAAVGAAERFDIAMRRPLVRVAANGGFVLGLALVIVGAWFVVTGL